MESVEASGKSIEDAILQALARLGRNRNEVEIQVLQEPSRGTRGMGVRDARVRVFLKAPRPAQAIPAGGSAVVTPDMAAEMLDVEDEEDATIPYDAEEPFDENTADGFADEEYLEDDEPYAEEVPEAITTAALRDILPPDASIEEVAVAALRVILAHMDLNAEVEVVGEDLSEEDPIVLNIRSDDPGVLSLLIGRRGETLSSLQLIVSQIVARQTGTRERIIVDAESYRERREQNLRSMARRIAQQVRRSGRPITLEAMPPNERRIIHMELSESDDLSTESTGEGDQRRVVVSLKHLSHA